MQYYEYEYYDPSRAYAELAPKKMTILKLLFSVQIPTIMSIFIGNLRGSVLHIGMQRKKMLIKSIMVAGTMKLSDFRIKLL